MKNGEELALEAMKKEHSRLLKIAAKAKAECDAYCNVGSELLAIHDEFVAIVQSKEVSKKTVEKLEVLKKRQDKAHKIMSGSLLQLSDKQIKAECEAQALASEIAKLEYRLSMRKRA